MGCVESVPIATSVLQVSHTVDPSIPILGGLSPSNETTELLMSEKTFSWSGDDFKIKRIDGTPFHNMKIKGKAFAMRDQMTLLDADNKLIAVCLRKFALGSQIFKIYTPIPLHPGQGKSNQDYNGQLLYTFAEVVRPAFSVNHQLTYDNQGSPAFTVSVVGFFPRRRVVKHRGVTAAAMEGGTYQTSFGNSYKLTICPGIDPCVMICLAAICDKMAED
jgi:uncharacterized protein YxjI